eukprot:ctg_5096.g508
MCSTIARLAPLQHTVGDAQWRRGTEPGRARPRSTVDAGRQRCPLHSRNRHWRASAAAVIGSVGASGVVVGAGDADHRRGPTAAAAVAPADRPLDAVPAQPAGRRGSGGRGGGARHPTLLPAVARPHRPERRRSRAILSCPPLPAPDASTPTVTVSEMHITRALLRWVMQAATVDTPEALTAADIAANVLARLCEEPLGRAVLHSVPGGVAALCGQVAALSLDLFAEADEPSTTPMRPPTTSVEESWTA